jgi:hypothetical protein
MPQSKKKRTDKRSLEQAPSLKVADTDRKGRRTGFIIAAVVIVLILVIVGISYYPTYVAPFRRTVITVDDVAIIRMDYFLKRTQMADEDPVTMLLTLTKEYLVKIGAPQYGIEVSPEEIDQELRIIAQGESENISESEFKEWYRQWLNEIGLSNSEYRDIVATDLLRSKLHEYLAVRMPTVADQVHLHLILVDTLTAAENVRARWEAGEDFADLAREVSLDETKENGGDLGWMPPHVLDSQFEYIAKNLSSGNISEPLPYYDESDPSSPQLVAYYLLMVSERADDREVDEEHLLVLQSRVVDDWLSVEMELHEISFLGIYNGFDSATYDWISGQLSEE